MRIILALVVAAIALTPVPAMAWGKTGHRVVGAIAETHLQRGTRAKVTRILGVESLAEASNWPDFMRSDPARFWQQSASPWHYVTVPQGKTYDQIGAPPEGDALTALKHYSAVLRNPRATLEDKRTALRFVIHLVGDLHQPLHAGQGSDRGGNDLKVTFMGRPTNLHSVWDSGLIDENQLSYSELTMWLNARIGRAQLRDWSSTDPKLWVAESTALRDRIYPAPGQTALGYTYIYQHQRELEDRLAQAGVRLAAYLNMLLR